MSPVSNRVFSSLLCIGLYIFQIFQYPLKVSAIHGGEHTHSGNSHRNEPLSRLNELHVNSDESIRTSLYIDEELQMMRQDDPKLIQIIKNNYLHPPSIMPYNLSNTRKRLDWMDGQFGQAKIVEDEFFKVRISIVFKSRWRL